MGPPETLAVTSQNKSSRVSVSEGTLHTVSFLVDIAICERCVHSEDDAKQAKLVLLCVVFSALQLGTLRWK